MPKRLAMRRAGTQFSAEGVNLSWPYGGEREVVEVSDETFDKAQRLRRRIAEGSIVETTDPVTISDEGEAREYRLLTGEEARKHKEEPAGPVVRFIYQRSDGSEHVAAVQEVRESDRFLEHQEHRVEEAEAAHKAIVDKQVEAEKEAAEKAKHERPKEVLDDFDTHWTNDQQAGEVDRHVAREDARNKAVEAQVEEERRYAEETQVKPAQPRHEAPARPTPEVRQQPSTVKRDQPKVEKQTPKPAGTARQVGTRRQE